MRKLLEKFIINELNFNFDLICDIENLYSINNSNFKINYNKKLYFVRICNNDIYINRKNEFNVLNISSKLGLCEKPLYFNKNTGNMLCNWVYGVNPCEEIIKSDKFLKVFCNNLKKLHYNLYGDYDSPFIKIKQNITFCRNNNIEIPKKIDKLIYKLDNLEYNLNKNLQLGLCHNDLNYSNIIFNQDNLYFIDYEFSSTRDIFFDFATISWFYEEEFIKRLLEIYFEKFYKEDYKKLLNYQYVVKLLNATWSLIKSKYNNKFYDYKKSANLIFDELIKEL